MSAAETRVKGALRWDLPGLDEQADGTVLSLPEVGQAGEVVVNESFTKAHLRPPEKFSAN